MHPNENSSLICYVVLGTRSGLISPLCFLLSFLPAFQIAKVKPLLIGKALLSFTHNIKFFLASHSYKMLKSVVIFALRALHQRQKSQNNLSPVPIAGADSKPADKSKTVLILSILFLKNRINFIARYVTSCLLP